MHKLTPHDREELAWAAGFFDGEGGTFRVLNGAKAGLSVTQKNPKTLRRFHNAVGKLGAIYGPIYQNKRKYHIYRLVTQKRSTVDTILTKLWPWLSSQKRQQARLVGFRLGRIRNPKVGRPKGRQS